MKVGILTFPNSISYGATLQMYALYRTVEKLGHEAEIINYHNAYMKAEKHVYTGHDWKKTVKKWARAVGHRRLYAAFRRFEEKNMRFYPFSAFTDKKKLPQVGEGYDAVICGSDQVWNPDITDRDISYFLDFCGGKTRRISYAPSFGVERLSPDVFDQAARELKKFHAISVREASGAALVKRMTGQDVPVVADPTMLLSAQDWRAMSQPHPMGQGTYILYYTVRGSASLWKYCLELSGKTGLPIVRVGGNSLQGLKNKNPNIQYAVDISPGQWLYLVDHARYVVTNSFHGTAFSINFRKEFYVEFSSTTNSRLEHITSTLGLQQRVIGEGMAEAHEQCDYLKTEERLPMICRDSMSYLEASLRKEENDG